MRKPYRILLPFLMLVATLSGTGTAEAQAGPCTVSDLAGNPFQVTCPAGVPVGSVGTPVSGVLFGTVVVVAYDFAGTQFPNSCCALFFGPHPATSAMSDSNIPDTSELPGGDVQVLTGFTPLFDNPPDPDDAPGLPRELVEALFGPDQPAGTAFVEIPLDDTRVFVMAVPPTPQPEKDADTADSSGDTELERRERLLLDDTLVLSNYKDRPNMTIGELRAEVFLRAFANLFGAEARGETATSEGRERDRVLRDEFGEPVDLGDGDIVF